MSMHLPIAPSWSSRPDYDLVAVRNIALDIVEAAALSGV